MSVSVCVCVYGCLGVKVLMSINKTNTVDELDHSLLQRGMNRSLLFLRREYHIFYNGNWQKKLPVEKCQK